MAKNIIKITPTKAVIQIIDAGATISLATDLLFTGQTVSGTPTVNITNIIYSCAPTENISVTRNSVKTLSVAGTAHQNFPYSVIANNTSDIVVVCPTNGMIFIELSKIAGYTETTIPNVGV